ncbi:Axial budding pattern protein [Lachnellula occidentalis]|uniref:Axial budding pattern protein n=1 Tax=Lachnellula occidentalis TaxID=215460 RepID=A0A8H8RPN5_9HELO|nr:Axial budding pattern protein [Lachnellula occidentalis]
MAIRIDKRGSLLSACASNFLGRDGTLDYAHFILYHVNSAVIVRLASHKLNDGVKMALRKIVAAAAIISNLTNATPTIDYPLNSQVPTIARVSQPFEYTFPSSTFSSASAITYNLSSGPSWLLLDSTTRTLSGTPSTADVGTGSVTGVAIDLTATDSSGSITLSATLAVSKDPAPVVSIPLSTQLPSFGAFSGPSTLLFHPSTPFKFKFDPETFSASGGSSNLSYYAVTSNNTPLPSWILFDETSLSFSGQTPDYSSLIQPPQTFGIRLIVSDIKGFAGASIVFYIEVGVHILSFNNADMFINTTAGSNISFLGLSNNLHIDGRPANASEITSMDVQTPPWLVFDDMTMALIGTAPPDIRSSNISVLATDIYGDAANATISLAVGTSIFSMSIPELNATIGAGFSYNLSTYLTNPSDVYISTNFTPSESWLSFDSPTFILSGQVPTSANPSINTITLNAISKSSHMSSSQSFELSVISATNPFSSATASSSRTSPTISGAGTSTPAPAHASHRLSSGHIAAIVTPILVVFAAVLLALFCYRRRRSTLRKRSMSPGKSEISGPLENLEAGSISSVDEIVLPPRVAAPDPLHLDTSEFLSDNTHHALTTNEKRMSPSNLPDRNLRRSQTTTSMYEARESGMSKRSSSGLMESSGNRIRSYSENALSKTDKSWRSTQDSSQPTVESSSRTNSSYRLTRTYSNFSRKGHTRRSARVLSSNLVGNIRESCNTSGQQSERSILNLTDSSFSCTPLENFTALSRNDSLRNEPEVLNVIDRPSHTMSKRRQSRLPTAFERKRSGIGHGGRASISSLSSKSVKRRSVGHGPDWMLSSSQSPALVRNSRTWLTVADSNRHSTVSATSVYSDTYPKNGMRMSIRQVAKSPPIAVAKRGSQSSQTSHGSRPVSRRVGSSPFFSSSSCRDSLRSPKRARKSYADSPTVPEESRMESLQNVVLHGLREEDTPPRDSFGIKYGTYGLAREGTRQLKTYIGELRRTKTGDSIRSTQSRDSRFESAVPSMRSLHQSQQPPFPTQNDDDDDDDNYEDYYSEGSWETHETHLPTRDSQGNIIEYSEDESPEVSTAARAAQARSRLSFVPTPRPKSRMLADPRTAMGLSARIVEGVGRRPISVDATATKGSVRAKVERQNDEGGGEDTGDYSAYI